MIVEVFVSTRNQLIGDIEFTGSAQVDKSMFLPNKDLLSQKYEMVNLNYEIINVNYEIKKSRF